MDVHMHLDQQMIFNGLLALGGGVVGLLVAILRESLKALRLQVRDLESKINDHVLSVATGHVPRPEFNSMSTQLFNKLEQVRTEQRQDMQNLLTKLDSKADK